MSFYSSLVLAANTDVRIPSEQGMRTLLFNLGILKRDDPNDQFGDLADDITDLFRDQSALNENPHFFCPDSVAFGAEIDICAPEAEEPYTGTGYSVRLHGNGYFYPWTAADVRERAIRTPKLQRLRQVLQAQLGGRFVIPREHEAVLREAWLEGSDEGWMWFGCESV